MHDFQKEMFDFKGTFPCVIIEIFFPFKINSPRKNELTNLDPLWLNLANQLMKEETFDVKQDIQCSRTGSVYEGGVMNKYSYSSLYYLQGPEL